MIDPSATRFRPSLAIHASAGSGKTHQLINRLLYLLLMGAKPGGILAITFTRKAAAEMTQRLLQRVQSLSTDDPVALQQQLGELNLEPNPALCERALNLYEELLYTPHPVRSTTFHAFCQDLLRRFPMEADVPPGFELLELTRQLQDEAWDNFTSTLTRAPNSDVALAMDQLLVKLGLHETRRVLFEFVEHRSDWWAMTQHQAQAIDYSYAQLQSHLDVDPGVDPLAEFFADQTQLTKLQRFHDLLCKHATTTNVSAAKQIAQSLQTDLNNDTRLETLWLVFFTTANTPRSRSHNKTLETKLGSDGVEDFLDLHDHFCNELVALRSQLHARDTLLLNRAWLSCGQALLDQYQNLKQNQRVLDFADLEWNSYLLLNAASHADWVQYKLDQRIDHLLVDEFQDTNPIQWQLLLPLLQELAASENERQRSVLFVGDSKQSIYSFRRAEPRLFDTASSWLEEHIPDTVQQTLSKSWRSSPAIIDFVNRVFEANPNLPLSHFEAHATAHPTLHGEVWLLPLIAKQKPPVSDELRNPLQAPRPQAEAAHYQEARQIAAAIQDLMNRRIQLGRPDKTHEISYSDIMILFRSRTRVNDFERALREAKIPYIGTERGTLLDSLEVSDMINLLQWLITPFNNLALAGILRSPLFAASDADLMSLAGQGDWFSTLLAVSDDLEYTHPLARAARALQTWIPLADQLPVHDLLDRIYSEANVMARYRAAFPEHLHPRVTANLTRFLELALENDSGRYPSLTRFMAWLKQLRQLDKDAPSQPPGQGEQDRIRLLTVHEAKGLEAPIVFVADASREAPADKGARVLVEWPAEAPRPQHFILSPAGKFPNAYSAALDARLQARQQQEDANLLYVALTRAEQYLYLSASNQDEGWYQSIRQAYAVSDDDKAVCLSQAGVRPGTPLVHHAKPVAETAIAPGLRAMIHVPQQLQDIAPSREIDIAEQRSRAFDEYARERGTVIHRMLEDLSRTPNLSLSAIQARHASLDPQRLAQYWREACKVIESFPEYFDGRHYVRAYSEVPVSYRIQDRTVYGIIDRLICFADKTLIVDYKTHRCNSGDDLSALAQAYRAQLNLYAQGVRQLFPDNPVHCALLFTALPKSLEIST